ncbi:MAG: chromate transporter [Comamonadaceae bacterium]|nr:chromate transporter [Comamonadaceae bacterium]
MLPYVYQGGVEHYGWLTGPQMIDGLALGETTPGPLIMVVAFVGFVGGVDQAGLRPRRPVAGRLRRRGGGDLLHLPAVASSSSSPAGRWSKRTRGDIKFTAPLTGITAAVVGVIVNLAVFFAWHAFWPQGTPARPSPGPSSGSPVARSPSPPSSRCGATRSASCR